MYTLTVQISIPILFVDLVQYLSNWYTPTHRIHPSYHYPITSNFRTY
jgi:hypothetical protein